MEDILCIGGCIAIGLFWGLVIGVGIASPTELENGCIVNNNKIYCEVEAK